MTKALSSPAELHQVPELKIWPSTSAAHYACIASYPDKNVRS